jgi:hypothetical protein
MLDDTSGGPLADSYTTLAQYTAYAQAMGWCDQIVAHPAEAALRRAAMAIDRLYPAKGTRTNAAQALAWPRAGVSLDGHILASDTVPKAVQSAQCEMARLILGGADPFAATSEQRITKRREKVDVIEEETEYEATGQAVSYPAVDSLLVRLIHPKGGHLPFSVPLTRV